MKMATTAPLLPDPPPTTQRDSSAQALLRRYLSHLAAMVAILAAATMPGCVAESAGESEGQVVVRWTPEAGTCEEAGIATVRIAVQAAGTTVAEVTDINCAAAAYTVAVTPGVRNVVVTGYGASGKVNSAAPPLAILIPAGASQTTPVMLLAPKLGSVKVAWRFAGDVADLAEGCALRQVSLVQVMVADGAAILSKTAVPCAQGSARIDGVPVGSHTLIVHAQSPVQALTYTAQTAITTGEAPPLTTWLDLQAGKSKGRLTAMWTVGGMPPALACKAAGIQSVDVHVLSNYKVTVEATRQVACGDGRVDFDELGLGKRWVLIIANTSSGGHLSSTPQVAGPYDIESNPASPAVSVVDFPVPAGVGPIGGVDPASNLKGLTIRWKFDAGAALTAVGCATKGVESVRVELLGASVANPPLLAVQEAPCSAGSVTFAAVPAGVVSTHIVGKNAQGATTYEGQAAVSGGAPAGTIVDVGLALTPISVTWTVLGSPAEVGCAKAGLDSLSVQFLPPAESSLMPKTLTVPCGSGGATWTGKGAQGVWLIRVSGATSGGESYGTMPLETVQVWANSADTSTFAQADLARTSANLAVSWVISKGNQAICDAADTHVHVLDKTGADYLLKVPCAQGAMTFVGLKPGTYFLAVTAVNKFGNIVLQLPAQPAPFTLAPGDNAKQTVELAAPK